MREKKISIVTPVFNGEKYIEECMCSIMNQHYSNYEHIIVDGGSTDNTLSIIKKYKNKYNLTYISEKDNGMYDAIVKGFKMSSGEILAWLNSDDIYMPWAFSVMNACINGKTEWCTGLEAHQNENGILYYVSNQRGYVQKWIKNGLYGPCLEFIQQESTFWSRRLWDRCNSSCISKYKLCGDFLLWKQFANETKLYSVNTVISCFRYHDGQLSQNLKKYFREAGFEKSTSIKKYYYKILNLLYETLKLNKNMIKLDKFLNIM